MKLSIKKNSINIDNFIPVVINEDNKHLYCQYDDNYLQNNYLYINILHQYFSQELVEKIKSGKQRIYYKRNELIELFWYLFWIDKNFPNCKDFKHPLASQSAINRQFGSFHEYLKSVGVVNIDNTDGWYIYDEQILNNHYFSHHSDYLEFIQNKLIRNCGEKGIMCKALKMGLKANLKLSKYNDNKFIDEAKKVAIDFYHRYDKAPRVYELKELGIPRIGIEMNWNSYNDFLIECNIPIFQRYVGLKNKSDGIKFLKNLSKKLGHTPTCTEADKFGIHKNWFASKFGTYKNALYESGLISKEESDIEIRIKYTIDFLKNHFNKTNSVPTYKEHNLWSTKYKILAANNLMDHLNISPYSKLCKHLYGDANVKAYTTIELSEMLFKLKNKIHRTPMARELTKYGLPSYMIYKTAFQARYFNDILIQIGMEPNEPYHYYKSDEELINDYTNLFKKLKRIPFREDVDREKNMVSWSVYQLRFKSLENVCKLSDIPLKNYLSSVNLGQGMVCIDYNGEICRSVPEMIITNFLIDSNINYIKECWYKVLNNHIKNKMRTDWVIDGTIAVEYFGLYTDRDKKQTGFIKRYNRDIQQKLDMCDTHNIPIIALYPYDLENNYQGLIEKFAEYGYIIKLNEENKDGNKLSIAE